MEILLRCILKITASALPFAVISAGVLWLTGCTMMSHNPELYPGVSEPRDLEDVDVRIKYTSLLTTDWHCRKQIREGGGTPVPILLAWYHSCATLPTDASIPDTGPYCKVVLPYGTEPEHEMKHCQGYAH